MPCSGDETKCKNPSPDIFSGVVGVVEHLLSAATGPIAAVGLLSSKV